MSDEYEQVQGANIWQPQNEGAELVGEIIDIQSGQFGLQYKLKNDEGMILTPSHKYLQNLMVGMIKGDNVRIVYTEERPPKIRGENPMKVYEVYKKK